MLQQPPRQQGELYGYGHSEVLFKPTKASEAQFLVRLKEIG